MIEELQNLTGDITPNQTLTGELDYRVTGGKVDDVLVDGTSVVENKIANIDLTGKQDVLTAGTNITIENNVISATGGNTGIAKPIGLGRTTDYTEQSPLSLDDLEYGVYVLEPVSIGGNNIYLWASVTVNDVLIKGQLYIQHNSTSNNILYFSYDLKPTQNRDVVGYLGYGYANKDLKIQIKYNENTQKIETGSTASTEFIDIWSSQAINSVKTFNALPESSVSPTKDTQLVNKKYVDDALANTSIFYAKRTEVFLNGTGGGSSNTAIDTDDLTEYNAQCLASKQFLPIAIKSSAVSNSINFVYMPRIRFNGKLQYMAFAYTSTGVFYMSQSQEISSPVIGSLVRTDLTFTTFTLKVATTDYVDTQIGNINTVLATLTTPTNGGN